MAHLLKKFDKIQAKNEKQKNMEKNQKCDSPELKLKFMKSEATKEKEDRLSQFRRRNTRFAGDIF